VSVTSDSVSVVLASFTFSLCPQALVASMALDVVINVRRVNILYLGMSESWHSYDYKVAISIQTITICADSVKLGLIRNALHAKHWPT
jgi:hypothetical protein